MKTRRPVLVWLNFFLTTSVVFATIAIPSFMYWNRKSQYDKVIPFGILITVLFSVIYATYKFKTLYDVEETLDFSNFSVNPTFWVERELVRLGFIPDPQGRIFSAGFRADYYMAPDFQVMQIDKNKVKIIGPCFYVRKLRRRFIRQMKRLNRKK